MARPLHEKLSTFKMMCRRLHQHRKKKKVYDLNAHKTWRHVDQMCTLRSYDKNTNTIIICNVYCCLLCYN